METKFEVWTLSKDGVLDQVLDEETGAPRQYESQQKAVERARALLREREDLEKVFVRQIETVAILP